MDDRNGRQLAIGGATLSGATAAAMLGMLHHPVVEGGTPAETAAQIAGVAGAAAAVHGVMIALVLALLFGVLAWARGRGLGRSCVLGGALAYGVGTMVMLFPPVLDGFVLPALAARAADDGAVLALYPAIWRFGFDFAIALAVLASLLMSLGVLLLGIDQLAERRFRAVGALGVGGGGIPLALLASGHQLTASGMTLVMALWAPWLIATGVTMLVAARTARAAD